MGAESAFASHRQLLRLCQDGNIDGARDLLSRGAPPDPMMTEEAARRWQAAVEKVARQFPMPKIFDAKPEVAAAAIESTQIPNEWRQHQRDLQRSRRDFSPGSFPSSFIPLFAAVECDSVPIVKLLRDAGANMKIRCDNNTSLFFQVRSTCMVELLLNSGVEHGIDNSYGDDALGCLLKRLPHSTWTTDEQALAERMFEIVAPAAPDLVRQRWMMNAASELRLASLEFLLDHGVPSNARLLHLVCFHDEPRDDQGRAERRRMIERLVAAGADVDARDEQGCTPLHSAVFANGASPTSASTLLALGASVDARNDRGDTPLHIAAKWDLTQLHCVEVLLRAGADPLLLDRDGSNALMLAAGHGSERLVRLLLSAGVDPNIRNQDGNTALDLARQSLADAESESANELRGIVQLLSDPPR